MAKAVSFGSLNFKSQTAAKAHFKKILDSYLIGSTILVPRHHKDLTDLLEDYNQKIVDHGLPSKLTAPICRFEKRRNQGDGWSTDSFWVICQDGQATDFSYLKAVRGKVDTPDENFYKACRTAISKDLKEYKRYAFKRHSNSEGEIKCPISGRWIALEQTHVDHSGPFYFSVIVALFRESKNWREEVPENLLTPPGPYDFSVKFKDRKIADDFRNVHNKYAALRLIAGEENLAQAYMARRPVIKQSVSNG